MNKKVASLGLAMAAAGGIILASEPANAQTSGGSGGALQNEIKKVEDVASMLSGLVTAFTTVLVTPMGISAAIKVFKTLVLFNL